MTWKLINLDEQESNGFTDEDIVNTYILLSHGSAPYHKQIAKKFEKAAKIASHNLHQENHWENEGGAHTQKDGAE